MSTADQKYSDFTILTIVIKMFIYNYRINGNTFTSYLYSLPFVEFVWKQDKK